MGLRLQPRNCDRARAWVSLRLDDEISELEERLLEAHLGRCAACHYPLERWPLDEEEFRGSGQQLPPAANVEQ